MRGTYEVELIENDKVISYRKYKNTVHYGFIGGLFKTLFGVGNTDAEEIKAKFGNLYLFTTTISPLASDTDTIGATYGDYVVKKLSNYITGTNTASDDSTITNSSVVIDSTNSQITLTFMVTFGPGEGLLPAATATTWNSMGIATDEATPRLISRVSMSGGITKTNQQTLRIRYNFTMRISS